MTRTRHSYELLYDAHRRMNKGHRDINVKINMKVTNHNGMTAVLLFYKSGIFKVNKRK